MASEIFRPNQVNSDLPAEDLPTEVVTTIRNAEAVNGYFNQARPFAPIFGSTLFQPRWLLPNQTDQAAYWCYAADTGIGVTDGVAHFDITPTSVTDVTDLPQPYTGGIINQRPVVNSLLDGPWWWDQNTANIMQDLPGWPVNDRCISMRPFREFLIAMNIFTNGQRIPDLVRWSDAAPPGEVPQNWTPSTQSQAGERSVSFNPGQLVDGRQLLDRFYMYKTSSTYVLQLIGGAFVFSNRPTFSTVGALGRGCIVEWRGRHIVLTDGDLIIHDGTNVESLINSRQRTEIFGKLDGTNFDNSYMTLNLDTSELLIARPLVGEVYPTTGITLSLEDLRFGNRDLNLAGTPHTTEGLVNVSDVTVESTWDQKTTLWSNDPTRWDEAAFARTADYIVMADFGDSLLQQVGLGADFGGNPINVLIERVNLDLGNSEVRKLGARIWPSINGAIDGEIFISMGASDDVNVAPVYGPEVSFQLGTDRFVDFDVQGYYLA